MSETIEASMDRETILEWFLSCCQKSHALFATIRTFAFADKPGFEDPAWGETMPIIQQALVDSWYMTIAALHDPARDSRGNENVGLALVLEQFKHVELSGLDLELKSIAQPIIQGRNKLIGHNDFDTFRKNERHGWIWEKMEVYYDKLKELRDLLARSARPNGWFEFPPYPADDAKTFVEVVRLMHHLRVNGAWPSADENGLSHLLSCSG